MTYNPVSCDGNGQESGGIAILYTFTDAYGNESTLTVDIDVETIGQGDLIAPAEWVTTPGTCDVATNDDLVVNPYTVNSYYNFDKPENAPKSFSLDQGN